MDDHKTYFNGDDGRDILNDEDKIIDHNAADDETDVDLQDSIADPAAAHDTQKIKGKAGEASSAVVQAGDGILPGSTDTAALQMPEEGAEEAGNKEIADGDEEGIAEQETDPVEEFLQQRKRRILIGLAIVGAAIAFLLAGWACKNLVMTQGPDDFIYAKSTAFLLIPNEDPDHIYLQIAGQEKEVCLKNVIPDSVVYLKKTDRVLAVTKSGDLLIKEPGLSEVKLSTKTVPGSIIVSADESSLLFLRNEKTNKGLRQGELYLLKLEGVNDKEKISSRAYIGDYEISPDGEKLLYISGDDLYLAEGQNKTKIGSEVICFNFNISFDTITFVNKEQELFLRDIGEDYSDKIATAASGLIFQDVKISDQSDHITYIEDYDVRKKSGELYRCCGLPPENDGWDLSYYQ